MEQLDDDVLSSPSTSIDRHSTTTNPDNDTRDSAYYQALSSHLSKDPTIIESSAVPEMGNSLPQSAADYHWRKELFDFAKELIILTKNRSWKKKVLTLLIVGTSLYVVIDLIWLGHVNDWITGCVSWLAWHPASAVFLFLLLFVACTFLFVPPAFLYFGAGFAFTQMTENIGFGILAASMVSYMGSLIGATLAFYRARYMMRDVIVLFSKRFPIIRAADQAFARNGFRVMLLLRLCPIIPFNGLNYIGGVLSVSTEEFTKALVGIVPAMMLWIYCGATSQVLAVSRMSEGGDGVKMSWIVLLGSGIGFGIIALVLTWRVAIKELTKEVAKDSAKNWFQYTRQDDGDDEESGHERKAEEGFEMVASQRILDIEKAHEDEIQEDGRPFHRRRRSSMILPLVGIDAHHLDDQYEPPDDEEDEEWFWLFA